MFRASPALRRRENNTHRNGLLVRGGRESRATAVGILEAAQDRTPKAQMTAVDTSIWMSSDRLS